MDEHILLYQQHIGCTINTLAKEVQQIASAVAGNPLVIFRVKDPETLRKKMKLKGASSVFSIDDVYGIRVIIESVEEAYRVLAEVSRVFMGYIDHDYIEEPKIRLNEPHKGEAFRLLQFIAYKNGTSFEIQITTHVFHAVNELLHEEYHRRKYQ